ADNPFVNMTAGKYQAIYAIGVRNPFGLATQPETGRMFFTDVGDSSFEEVNELLARAKYGWPHSESYTTHTPDPSPLFAYPPVVGRSVVGALFIPRSAPTPPGQAPHFVWPAKWSGKFLFADYMNHWIKALNPDVPEGPAQVTTFASGLNGPVALALAAD